MGMPVQHPLDPQQQMIPPSEWIIPSMVPVDHGFNWVLWVPVIVAIIAALASIFVAWLNKKN